MNKTTLAKGTRRINKIGPNNIRYLTIQDSEHCGDYYDIYAVTNDNDLVEILQGLSEDEVDDYKNALSDNLQ